MKTYTFDKLSEAAKETAREWYKEGGLDYDWWEHAYEDAETWLGYCGFSRVEIYHAGFCSQGDGACFIGEWASEDVNISEAFNHCGGGSKQTERAKDIATRIAAIALIDQRLNGHLTKGRNNYSNEYAIDILIESYDSEGDFVEGPDKEVSDEFTEVCRDAMRWIYRNLEAEYRYLLSDEAVDESIKCNEYRFYNDGTRATDRESKRAA